MSTHLLLALADTWAVKAENMREQATVFERRNSAMRGGFLRALAAERAQCADELRSHALSLAEDKQQEAAQ